MVYNKQDLAGLVADQKKIIRAWDAPSTVLFQSSKGGGSTVSELLKSIRHRVLRDGAISVQGVRILVLGMPNVGKSTILNALRHVSLGKQKAAKTGAQPGITRSTNSIFKVLDDPVSYLVDTPGIMVPFIPNSETMLKLGLVNCVKDSIIDPITLADYLLYTLNLRDPGLYESLYRTASRTNHVHTLLEAIGRGKGKLKKGGEVDADAAARVFVQDYRDGKFGHFSLDRVFSEALAERVEEEGRYLSKSQVRRGATVRIAQREA